MTEPSILADDDTAAEPPELEIDVDNPTRSTAQVVEPKWAVRVDYRTEKGTLKSEVRVSDATDAAVAAEDVLADLRTRRADATVHRIEAFAPSTKNLVPRGVFG